MTPESVGVYIAFILVTAYDGVLYILYRIEKTLENLRGRI